MMEEEQGDVGKPDEEGDEEEEMGGEEDESKEEKEGESSLRRLGLHLLIM